MPWTLIPKNAFEHQGFTDRPKIRFVDPQNLDCHAADRRSTNEITADPLEVYGPVIPPRMEKRNKRCGDGVYACNIGALVTIAVETRQGKIVQPSLAAMLAADDVVYVKDEWISRRRKAAILTPTSGPRPDLPSEVSVHEFTELDNCSPRTTRAFDCITARMLPTWR